MKSFFPFMRMLLCVGVFTLCTIVLSGCIVDEIIQKDKEQEQLDDYQDWLNGLNVTIAKSNLWDMWVVFPEESWEEHLTFQISDNQNLEGGIYIPVTEGKFPLKGLNSNTLYYYCLSSDLLSMRSTIHSFITPYYSPVSLYLSLSEDGSQVKCELLDDIPVDSIVEKGFYSEQEKDWRVVVYGSDFSIPIDSAMYSMRGYVIQSGGMSSSIQDFKVDPLFGPITETYRNNELILQCKITCCRFGAFQFLTSKGEWRTVDADYVEKSYNGCTIMIVAPDYPTTIRPTALGCYGEEYILNRSN